MRTIYIWLYKQTEAERETPEVIIIVVFFPNVSRIPSVASGKAIPPGALLYGQIIYKYELLITERRMNETLYCASLYGPFDF